ncbi:MAG: coenzyme F420-0:L-glutamate ligase [Candidatus Buchananbacteria bacterium]|nr:coenzyme F420-0:L-glutamate ligase [Candidatus Buchananbacteria bacterium]
MNITSIKTSLFKQDDRLEAFVIKNLPKLQEGDIVVVTSKIVALAQGRVGKLEDKQKLIKCESRRVIKTPWAFLTLTDDGWCINAGIDESNAGHQLILMPHEPFVAAQQLRRALKKHFKLQRLGVLITDTKSVPLRVGTIGRAVGFAGYKPLKSYVGKRDIFGRTSRDTVSNCADALAAAAVLMMGEGAEQTPLAVISEAPVQFIETVNPNSKKLAFDPQQDIFKYVYRSQK